MKSSVLRLVLVFFALIQLSQEKATLNECDSNPCPDVCDICIHQDIRCIRAPCPQYTCQRNETCYNNRTVDEEKHKNPNCFLPVDPGKCLAYFPKWFYNATSERCEKFIYGGCGGNENKYSTQLECERICIEEQECPMVKLPAPKPGCRYSQDPGPDGCPTNELICDVKPGNCPLNSNRISSDSCVSECSNDADCSEYKKCCSLDCNRLCLSPEIDNATNVNDLPKSKICLQDKDSGPCEAAISRWYFDSKSFECKQFFYGGCQGNSNRFSTKKECERVCLAGKDCVKLKEVSPPEGCRFQAELDEDACPMNKLICDVKPGACPLSADTIPNVCSSECTFDNNCSDDLKCCTYDCNYVCMSPLSKNDTVAKDPKPIDDLCPTGLPVAPMEHCPELCFNNSVCESNQMCCRNGCGGTECMTVMRTKSPVCNLFCPFSETCKIVDGVPQCVPTVVCPIPLLAPPPDGCTYVTEKNAGDQCPRYVLVCNNTDPCSKKPCKLNERCAVLPCFVAPCTEYQCLPVQQESVDDNPTDVSSNGLCKNNDCLPCQKCIKTPLMCVRAPCRQYMCQDACGECTTCTLSGFCQQAPQRTGGNVGCNLKLCENKQCRLYPQAKCFIDKCNCDRYLYRLPDNTVVTPGQCTNL